MIKITLTNGDVRKWERNEYTLPKYCPECGARLEDETDG